MYRGFGRGRNPGSGASGLGLGFRGSTPPWPYIGRGRGGQPRCAYYTGASAPASTANSAPKMSGEEELNYLKNQAQAIKNDLERINARVQELESQK